MNGWSTMFGLVFKIQDWRKGKRRKMMGYFTSFMSISKSMGLFVFNFARFLIIYTGVNMCMRCAFW